MDWIGLELLRVLGVVRAARSDDEWRAGSGCLCSTLHEHGRNRQLISLLEGHDPCFDNVLGCSFPPTWRPVVHCCSLLDHISPPPFRPFRRRELTCASRLVKFP